MGSMKNYGFAMQEMIDRVDVCILRNLRNDLYRWTLYGRKLFIYINNKR